MGKCKNCEIDMESGQKICPLCFANIESGDENDIKYPEYGGAYEMIKRFTIKKLFMFLSVAAGFICLFINIILIKDVPYLWSFFVVSPILSVWGIYRSLRSKKMILGGKLLACYIILSAYIVSIDLFTGLSNHSINYVIPFLTIAIILLITIITLIQKRKYKDYLGYLLATLFISGCPLVLCFLSFLLGFSIVIWPSIAAIGYGLLTGIAFYIFMDKDFKIEMKKKFHL